MPLPPAPRAIRLTLSVAEAAQRLGVPKDTVLRLVRSGELPSARSGRMYRIPVAAVAARAAAAVTSDHPRQPPRTLGRSLVVYAYTEDGPAVLGVYPASASRAAGRPIRPRRTS